MEPSAGAGRPRRPRIRRRGDLIAFVIGLVGVAIAVLLLGRVDHVSPLEIRVFRAVNGWPNWPGVVLDPVMDLGVVVAVPIVAVICAIFRRFVMGAVVAVSGGLAYGLAILSKHAIGRNRPGVILEHVHIRGVSATGLGFPSGHAAVSTAIAVAVIGYLGWPKAWWLLVLPALVGLARIYVGAHLPLDVLGGVSIGLATASAVHLLVGYAAPEEGPELGAREPLADEDDEHAGRDRAGARGATWRTTTGS
jgi:undecaprenyl-diphosphatase